MWWLLLLSYPVIAFTYKGIQFTPTGNIFYAACTFGGSPAKTVTAVQQQCAQPCELDGACKAYNFDGASTCSLFYDHLYDIPISSQGGLCGILLNRVVAPSSNDCSLSGDVLTCNNPSSGGNGGGSTGGGTGGNTGSGGGSGSGSGSGGGNTPTGNGNTGGNGQNSGQNSGQNNGQNNGNSNNGNSNNGNSNPPATTANGNTPAKPTNPSKPSNAAVPSTASLPGAHTADQPIASPIDNTQSDPNTSNSPQASSSALTSTSDKQSSGLGTIQIISFAAGGTIIFIGAIALFYKKKSTVSPLSSKAKKLDSSSTDVKIKMDSLATGDSTLNTRNESGYTVMFGFGNEEYNEMSMTSQEMSYRKKTESQLKQEYDAIYEEVEKLPTDNFIYEDQKNVYYFADQAGIGQFIDLISVLLLPEDVSAETDLDEFGIKKGDEIRIVTHLYDGYFIGIIEGTGIEEMMPVSLIPKPKEPEITLLLCLEYKQEVNLDHYILTYAQQLYPELIKINILVEYKSLDPSNYSNDKLFKTITGKEKVLIHNTPELVEFIGWYLKGITDDLWIYFDVSVISDSFSFKSALSLDE
ncbi:hypothetical protein HDV06_001971 [Boothiomyces sp. JEL0866]|nr:hypothetical protein HDV06_001971 [Boothiomyces sp. JEL0866]